MRRLVDSGDFLQARQRLAAMRKAFPSFKPLLGLAWEVEDRGGAPLIACARAYEWHLAAPNSRAAIEALCDSARAGGLAAVYASTLQRLSALDGQEGRSHSGISDTRWEQQWQALLDTCDAHGDYLMCAVDFGDDASRMLALSVLKQRARRHDRVAVSSLTALLTHPSGPDSARMELLNWLIEEGLRDRKEPADVWIGGELRPIRSHGFRISDKQHPSPFPPQGVALNERIHAAIGAHNLPLALDLAQQLHQMYPDQPLTLTNLAAIMEGLGRPLAEVADLFRRAFALAPDDLFARCGLARCFAKEGDIDQARTLLDGILEREEFHRSEYRSLLMAQRAIAVATGDHQSVLAVDQSLVDIEQSPKD